MIFYGTLTCIELKGDTRLLHTHLLPLISCGLFIDNYDDDSLIGVVSSEEYDKFNGSLDYSEILEYEDSQNNMSIEIEPEVGESSSTFYKRRRLKSLSWDYFKHLNDNHTKSCVCITILKNSRNTSDMKKVTYKSTLCKTADNALFDLIVIDLLGNILSYAIFCPRTKNC